MNFLPLIKYVSFSHCSKLSAKDGCNNSFLDIKPIVKYVNADTDKVNILSDNRNKSGVYRWINNINGNTYVGSSVSLSVRFYTYYSLRSLAKSNRRYFSTSSPACSPIIPEKHYSNADLAKIKILAENKGKSGIYL